MTRRDRHLNIIGNFGNFYDSQFQYRFDALIRKRGLAALTDEAIEELATDFLRSRRLQNEMNERNRELRKTAEAR